MASFTQKYNKGNVNPFTFNIEGYTFTTLKELFKSEETKNKVHSLDGFYFIRGKYGVKAVVVMTDVKKRVDMPIFLTRTFNDIVKDAAAVAEIKQGKIGFIVRKYDSHGKECYSITFKEK